MKFESFEDIIAWQKAKELTLGLYKVFNTNKDYCFKNQILSASISIMNNIAEGFERKSNKEFKHFLFISKGSCAEVRSMILLGKDINYFTENNYKVLLELSITISKILSGLIKSIKD